MKYRLVLRGVVLCIFVVGCEGKETDKNPISSAGDSAGTSSVVEDSTEVPPIKEVPIAAVYRIAFISGQPGESEIFLWKTDGSAPVNLTQKPGQYYGLTWSPDGSKLAFISRDNSGILGGDIYVLAIEGKTMVKLTNQQGSYGNLTWSPDGTHLAFSFQRKIYVMNVDGSEMKAVTTGSELGYDSNPAWSPDGSRIAFSRATTSDTVSFEDIIVDIYDVKSEGTRLTRLTEEPLTGIVFSSLSWSPDGSQIIFTLKSGTGISSDQDIYLLNSSEGNFTNLTNSLSSNEFDPAWSPDGNQIAFSSYGVGIYVLSVSGRSRTALSLGNDGFPKWSPDGQRIAYIHYASELDIYLTDAAGGSPVNLTEQNPVPTKGITFFTDYFAWAPN